MREPGAGLSHLQLARQVALGDGLTKTIAKFEETARVFDECRHTLRAIMGRSASAPDDHQEFITTAKRIRDCGGYADPAIWKKRDAARSRFSATTPGD